MTSESSSGPVEALDGHIDSNFSEFAVLSSSGHNTLYRAKRFGQWFVLKALSAQYIGNPIFEGLLEKEFVLGVKLNHQHIAHTLTFECIPGLGNCIVMEFVDGVTLDLFLAQKPSEQERLRLTWQILDAMRYFHSLQIVHRDVKPKNILVTRNGSNVKIIDFGLSDSDNYAVFKQPAGSAKFMAPEQFDPNVTIDQRADIYSLGIILNELLPVRFGKVVQRCVKYRREERYQSVDEVIGALRRVEALRRTVGQVAMAVLVLVAVVAVSVWLTSHFASPVASVVGRVDTVVRIDTIVSVDTVVRSVPRAPAVVAHDQSAQMQCEAIFDSLKNVVRKKMEMSYVACHRNAERDSSICRCAEHMMYFSSVCAASNIRLAQSEVAKANLPASHKESLLQNLILYNIQLQRKDHDFVSSNYLQFNYRGLSSDEIDAHRKDLLAIGEKVKNMMFDN